VSGVLAAELSPGAALPGFWLVLLLALPTTGALALPLMPPGLGARIAVRLGTVVTALTVPVAVLATQSRDVDVEWVPALGVHFHLGADGISGPLVVLTAGLTFLCLVYTERMRPPAGRLRAFVGLILLLEVGMLGTFVALDLLLFFVFFEVVLLPMWFLIAVWGGEGKVAAANKFILYTLLGSALMLLGLLLIGLRAGTFDMVELAAAGGAGIGRGTQVLAFVAVAIGLAVKTPMWPLHTWLPDAHTAAPTVGSVLLAGVLLKMGAYGFVRIGLPVTPYGAEQVAPFLGALGVVGIVYGSLACLAQRDLKRLIAYSSVGHMGFVLLGIATLTEAGVNGALFANVAHGLITGLLFFLVGAIKDRHGSARFDVLGRGLYARLPRLGGLLAFACIASLGLPGLAGFWGEMLAMLGAFQADPALDRELFLVLMALAGVGTVLTAAYLLTLLRRVAQGAGDGRWDSAVALGDVTRHEAVVWAPIVVAVLLLGLWPGLLLDVTAPAVRAVLGGGA
jgi:NADH-quinone oxidoreductase subunit M